MSRDRRAPALEEEPGGLRVAISRLAFAIG
jgi:hypothetical protein